MQKGKGWLDSPSPLLCAKTLAGPSAEPDVLGFPWWQGRAGYVATVTADFQALHEKGAKLRLIPASSLVQPTPGDPPWVTQMLGAHDLQHKG